MAAKVKIVEEPFRVPSLSESDDEYRALMERHHKVNIELGQNRREQDALEADLKKTPATRSVRAGLADILGETVEIDQRPARLAELKKRQRDLDEAAAILFKRMQDRRSAASGKVCDLIRPEVTRRIGALAAALEAVQQARLHFENLLSDLEAEDVSWSRLGVVRPSFLGDYKDGHIPRFLKEVKEAGYV